MVEGTPLQIVILGILVALFHLKGVQVKEHHALALRYLPRVEMLHMKFRSGFQLWLIVILRVFKIHAMETFL